MAAMPSQQDLMQLFDVVLSGRADESELRRLESYLEADSGVREQFALLAQLDVDLRHLFRTGAFGARAAANAPIPISHDRHSATTASSRQGGKKWWLWSLSLAAAIGLVAAMVQLAPVDEPPADVVSADATTPLPTSKPPGPVATLTMQKGVAWKSTALEIGQTIREGDSVELASGEAQISVGYGAEIAAEGPCSLTFVSHNKVRLDYGNIAVRVAEWATEFTVVTDAMDVVDLGTTFTVSATQGAGAQTKVLEGLVRVHPRVAEDGRRGVLVSEGDGFSVDTHGRRDAFEQAPVDLFDNLNWGALIPYRPLALFNTGVGYQEGDEDPHWRVVAGPPDSFTGPQYAVVCTPDERYLANDRDMSQWVSMANWRTATPNSVYTFQTMFDLAGYDLSTIQLFGRFLADNGIHEVRVNGRPVKVESWIDNVSWQEFDHSQFRFVNVTEGLVAGTNMIEIDVANGIFQEPAEWRGDPNPMALRVEWYAFGRKTNRSRDL